MITNRTRDEIASLLFKSEAQIDKMIADTAALMSGVASMRSENGSTMLETQKPLARMARINQLLADARLKLTGVHGDLAKMIPNARDLTTGCPCGGAFFDADEAAASA